MEWRDSFAGARRLAGLAWGELQAWAARLGHRRQAPRRRPYYREEPGPSGLCAPGLCAYYNPRDTKSETPFCKDTVLRRGCMLSIYIHWCATSSTFLMNNDFLQRSETFEPSNFPTFQPT